MWTQIVGKTRLALTPLENHWWNVPLYVTPRGLTTSAIPYGSGAFEIDFDFIAHKLWIRTSADKASFDGPLSALGCRFLCRIHGRAAQPGHRGPESIACPVEFDDLTPFDQDQHHASYDAEYVDRFRRILIQCERVFKEFRCAISRQVQSRAFFLGIVRSGRDALLRPPRSAERRRRSRHSRGLFA